LEEHKKTLDELNTVALGLSIDTIPSKNAWAKTLMISETALLCDFWPHGEVAKRYGLFRDEQGTSQRANLIIDDNGILVWKKVYPIPELPDIEEVIQFLKN
jgi:alkyl hydroperoxide reductase subunit AhpC